jgi:hypothetical protein
MTLSVKSVFIVLVFALPAAGQIPDKDSCRQAADQFESLNQPLLKSHPGSVDGNPDSLKKATGAVEHFVGEIVTARLTDVADVQSIRAYLACMQAGKDDRPWEELTDTPLVFQSDATRTSLSALLVMRGGLAVPDTRAIVQCFAKSAHGWKLVGNLPDANSFNGHTLNVYPLDSPIPDEAWYLVSGRAIGGTGGPLRIEVVSCTPGAFRQIWQRDDITWGHVEVTPGNVRLTFLKHAYESTSLQPNEQIGPGSIIMDKSIDPAPIKFTEDLRITRSGLGP